MIFMYAKTAPKVKMAENAITLMIEIKENGGYPSKKLRIMSDAPLRGFISARVTRTAGNLPSFPKS